MNKYNADEIYEDFEYDLKTKFIKEEDLKKLLFKFKNPIRDDSSIAGDFVDIRLFKEDWEEIKEGLKR